MRSTSRGTRIRRVGALARRAPVVLPPLGTGEIVAVDLEGDSEIVGRGPHEGSTGRATGACLSRETSSDVKKPTGRWRDTLTSANSPRSGTRSSSTHVEHLRQQHQLPYIAGAEMTPSGVIALVTRTRRPETLERRLRAHADVERLRLLVRTVTPPDELRSAHPGRSAIHATTREA
jgi:hypothetical protein